MAAPPGEAPLTAATNIEVRFHLSLSLSQAVAAPLAGRRAPLLLWD
jgi:hypothetical protein